jgi:CheY-like chemotaxis protein
MHGGELTVFSDGIGHGASFTLTLDTIAARTGSSSHPSSDTDDEQASRRIRVLVVDDHVDTGNVIRILLERDGHLVETAVTLREAVERAVETSFDLLISDIGLPDGSGIDLIEQLGERRPSRAIALSGFGMDEDVRRSLDAGFAQHLTKPVTMARLREVIASLFG